MLENRRVNVKKIVQERQKFDKTSAQRTIASGGREIDNYARFFRKMLLRVPALKMDKSCRERYYDGINTRAGIGQFYRWSAPLVNFR